MIFPLLKTMLKPLLGSLLTTKRSTNNKQDATPRDMHTFGGTSARSWRGRGPPTANPITNVTFNESEERIVDELHMQDLKTWSESSSGHPPSNHKEKGNNNTSNILKCVEVAVVSEDRPRRTGERRNMSNEQENHQAQGNCSFARGPTRTSFHAGNQM
jgi:hypothetical protein